MAKQATMLLVKSAVKDHLKDQKMMCSSDLYDAVSKRVTEILDNAAERTKSNGRSTVRAGDV